MVAAILFGPLSLQILFLIIAILALQEFYKLIEGEISPQVILGIITGLITYIVVAGIWVPSFSVLSLIYACIAVLFIAELYRKKNNPFTNIALTITGIIYIVLPFALLVNLSFRNEAYSWILPLGFFILLWCSDTFAYIAGMSLGKHRLFERISPKKSWEGSIGGTVAALIAAYILFRTVGYYSLTDWMVIAVIIVVAGTFGDLTESMLKRSLDKKDSGSILPGHGGLLDRFDGLFIAMPFIYLYLSIR